MSYVGRFAPSPTGPLHFGSLVAAVASYCDAKAHHGKWLLRMEDLDKPREIAGAADAILRQLQAFGFEWNDELIYQSQRSEIYDSYLHNLKRNGFIYACNCSRKEIADSSTAIGIDGIIYPKTCFNKKPTANSTSKKHASASLMDAGSWRINVDNAGLIVFEDAIQDSISQQLARDVGDFILQRKDGIFAYQLAVVVDDALQNISHIVRGADLLDSTPRQIYLQYLLDLKTPSYSHIPIAVNNVGEKLSKQTLAKPIEAKFAAPLIIAALQFLGQNPPADLAQNSLPDIWLWAIQHWHISKVSKAKMTHFSDTF